MKGIVIRLCCCTMFAACCVGNAEGKIQGVQDATDQEQQTPSVVSPYRVWLGEGRHPRTGEVYYDCFRLHTPHDNWWKQVYGESWHSVWVEGKIENLTMVNTDGFVEVLNDLSGRFVSFAKAVGYLLKNDNTIDPSAVEELTNCYRNCWVLVNQLIPELAAAFKNAGVEIDANKLRTETLPTLEQADEDFRPEWLQYSLCKAYVGDLRNAIKIFKPWSYLWKQQTGDGHPNELVEQIEWLQESTDTSLDSLTVLPPVKAWLENRPMWREMLRKLAKKKSS